MLNVNVENTKDAQLKFIPYLTLAKCQQNLYGILGYMYIGHSQNVALLRY